jgi:polysaccharide deacetylase family protein (PEP-CTERM system associated)
MGWVAERCPEIIREVGRRGHEIASQGYCHRGVRELAVGEFREDLARSREALERASGMRVTGNRCARPLVSTRDLWALDVLVEEGYQYDSSLLPIFRSFHRQPWRRFLHQHSFAGQQLWEFPFSTWDCLGCLLPIAGGFYFRQIPHLIMKRRVDHWHRTYPAPFVMYFHVWELDAEQPKISAASLFARVRHYRNLGKTSWVIKDYLKNYGFNSVANYLGIPQHCGTDSETKSRVPEVITTSLESLDGRSLSRTVASTSITKTPVTIVVPFFNEEAVLPYFFNTLSSVESELSKSYDLHFVFVDDGSCDKTWELLQQCFGARADCKLLRHPSNLGVAAAILNGIRNANTGIVCSIDSDCSYDPHQLRQLIPVLTDGLDMVTGSPYHPKGSVLNVPAWRLALSKSASFLYRRVLRQKMHTYTSCFRVYRRSAIVDLEIREQGFLGIAEMIGKLDIKGCAIREYPVTLEVRLLGESKMKVIFTIFGHLVLLSRLLWSRLSTVGKAQNHHIPEILNASERVSAQEVQAK